MSNDIRFVIEGTNHSDSAFRAVNDDLDKMKGHAKAAGVDLDSLAGDFAKVAGQTDVFGGKLQGTGSFAQVLESKLSHLQAETRRLGEEFNRTGNTNVLAKMFTSQDAEAALKRLSGRLASAIEEGGQEGSKDLNATLQGGLSTPGLGPAVGVAVASSILTAAPLILAALNGALLAAAGGGGLALGIMGQVNDPAVHNAFVRLGADLTGTLGDSTSSFREPLVHAAETLGTSLKAAIGSIDFSDLAKSIEPLARGLGGLITNLMPGFNKALEAAGPILDGLGADLPKLGAAIGEMLEHFAEGGKGAGEALHLLVIIVGSLAEAIGLFVLVGSKMLEWFFAAGEKIGDFISHIDVGLPLIGKFGEVISEVFHWFAGDNNITTTARNLRSVGENAKLSADDIGTLTEKLSEVSDATSDLAAKWVAKLFGEMMGIDQATLHWHESLTTLNDTLSKNGLAIDRRTHLLSEDTKAGEQNHAAILAAISANEQQYQAMVAGGISATDAAKAYDDNTAALERQLHAAGYTAAQIDDLIGKYRNVPDQVNTALAVQGLTEAINNLGRLEAAIHGIDGREFGFTVTEKHVYESDYVSHSRGEHASGGIAGGLISMNEHGWEAVHLPQGSTVIPHGASQALLDDTLSRPRGGDGAKLELTLKFEGSSNNWLLGALREAARHNEFKIYDSTGGESAIY